MRHHLSRGFTLIELLIVVIIIAILAAIAIPQFSNSSGEASEAALDSNLNTLRSAVELYRVQHKNVLPGVNTAVGTDAACGTAGGTLGTGTANQAITVTQQLTGYSNAAGQTCTVPATGFALGPYLRAIPADPIGNTSAIAVATTAGAAPSGTTGGWHLNLISGKVQVNSTAARLDGTPYASR